MAAKKARKDQLTDKCAELHRWDFLSQPSGLETIKSRAQSTLMDCLVDDAIHLVLQYVSTEEEDPKVIKQIEESRKRGDYWGVFDGKTTIKPTAKNEFLLFPVDDRILLYLLAAGGQGIRKWTIDACEGWKSESSSSRFQHAKEIHLIDKILKHDLHIKPQYEHYLAPAPPGGGSNSNCKCCHMFPPLDLLVHVKGRDPVYRIQNEAAAQRIGLWLRQHVFPRMAKVHRCSIEEVRQTFWPQALAKLRSNICKYLAAPKPAVANDDAPGCPL